MRKTHAAHTPPTASETSGTERRQANDRRSRELGLPAGVLRERRVRVEQRKPRVEEVPMEEWEKMRQAYLAAGKSINNKNPALPSIEWESSMHVGIPQLDQQNRMLLTRMNAIHLSVLGGEPRKFLNQLFEEFLLYVKNHFAIEERVMARVGYTRAASHKDLHRLFVSQLTARRLGFERGELPAEKLREFIVSWLIGHLEDEDTKIGRLHRLSGST